MNFLGLDEKELVKDENLHFISWYLACENYGFTVQTWMTCKISAVGYRLLKLSLLCIWPAVGP